MSSDDCGTSHNRVISPSPWYVPIPTFKKSLVDQIKYSARSSTYNQVQCTLAASRVGTLFCPAKRLVYFAERQSCRVAAEIDNLC